MSAARAFIAAVVAALAILALAGAGTAAAEMEATVACPEAPITGDECEGEAYEAGTAISASSEEVIVLVENIFLGIDGELKCESTFTGESVEDTVEPPLLSGEVTGLSFTSCEENFGKPCTVTTVNLSYESQLEHELSDPGDGELFVYQRSGGGKPGATVVCNEGPVAVNCTYLVNENASEIGGGATDLARLEFDGSAEPTIVADEVVFEEAGGTCPGSNPELSGTYEVNEPAAMFAAQKKWDFEVKPDPIPIAKVNDVVSVEVKNTGKTDWNLILIGVPEEELFLDAKDCVDKDKKPVLIKAGSKCTPTLKCLKKGESEFLIGFKLPWKSTGDYFTATKCEVK